MNGLVEFRKELRMSRREMAETLEISHSMYEKVELGQRSLTGRLLRKIKEKFPQVDMNKFF